MSPMPTSSCRSRFEPSGVCESFTWRTRRRSSPICASRSSSPVSSASGSDTSTPDAHQWHESRQRPRRGWRSTASESAASSEMERPIVPPAPAAFSMQSQRSSVVSSRSSRSAGSTSATASSKPRPRCEPTWNTTASDADRVRRLHRRPQRHERVLADDPICAREIDEVQRVTGDGLDARLPPSRAEPVDLLRCVRRRPPHARALREDLDGVAADLLDTVDRLRDASCS